ncbi:MAG: putative Ig domain-containing protein, partial [Betaproteobacteria bacterium]
MIPPTNPAYSLMQFEFDDIAAYIGQFVGNPNPPAYPVAYNSPGTAIPVPNLALNTSYGDYTNVLLLATAPTKGNVSFSGLTATYTPFAGQSGPDSFSFRAVRSVADDGGMSSLRSIGVSIAAPVSPAFTNSASTTFYIGVGSSFTFTASGSPVPTVSSSGSLPASLSLSGGAGSLTLSGTAATMTTGSYPLTLTASNGIAPSATQNFTLVVSGAPQSIDFVPPTAVTYSTTAFSVSATATSGLPVVLASQTPSVCTVSGFLVTTVALGTCTLAADQAGNGTFGAAQQILRQISVGAIPQTVTFGTQTTRNFLLNGTFDINPLATSNLGLAITYSSLTPGVCTLSGVTVTMVSTGTCTLRASQPGTATVGIASADQAFAINPPPGPGLPNLITPKLPVAVRNQPYAGNVMTGGNPVVTAAVISSLPAGLSAVHNGSGSLAITGTPTQAGVFSPALSVTNATGTSNIALNLTVVDTANYASNVAVVSAGSTLSCAIVSGGLQCWGSNVGDGNSAIADSPRQTFAAGSGVTHFDAGTNHGCAVIKGGVKCWGANNAGQLGNNSMVPSLVPVIALAEGSGATSVSAGSAQTCAVVTGGVQCWGTNTSGELGVGDNMNRLVPTVAIPGGSGATAVSTGTGSTCAVVAGGVRCWGSNTSGELGVGPTPVQSPVPLQAIAAASGVTQIGVGGAFACALANGGAQCWGLNQYGKLGTGDGMNHNTPTSVFAPGSGVTSLGAGTLYACVAINGGVRCWGYNYDGELG